MTFDRIGMHYHGYVQPLTGLWVAGGNHLRATDMEALRAWAGCGNEPVAVSMLPISIYVLLNTNKRTPLD